MDSYDPTDLPSGYPSLPKHVDDVIQSAPWDPLVSVRYAIKQMNAFGILQKKT